MVKKKSDSNDETTLGPVSDPSDQPGDQRAPVGENEPLDDYATIDGSAEYSRKLSEQRPDQLPSTVGPYRILKKIAEGGMGAVCLAEQSEPIERRVAIKLIKVGFQSSRQIIARFEAERQALAMMEHPNIAKILDGGTTDEGQPYFVMELVDGIPITDYCDRERLSISERLQLFHAVCKALQHAHTKGIIHRDLKPSNVLVTQFDGVATPKVIDFGLAKAIKPEAQIMSGSVHTEFGQLLGTLQYMSPEQANLDNLDIDARTDIYSLGVILYELLVGRTPLDQASLEQNAMLHNLEIIRESDPAKPSSQLSSNRQRSDIASQRRQITSSRLRGLLKGELDWVVMKALEKHRARRYETADRFADDVERYLSDRAVMARPPSFGYRFQKLFRRHRGAFAAGFLVTATLIVASIVAIAFGIDSNRQRIKAEQATERAVHERKGQAKLTRQLSQLLDAGDPLLGRLLSKYGSPFGQATSLADVVRRITLDELADKTELLDYPQVRAELLNTLGDIALSSGDVRHSRNVFVKSRDLLQPLENPNPQQVGKAQMAIAVCDYLLGDMAIAKVSLQQFLATSIPVYDEDSEEEIKRDRAFGTFVLAGIYIEEENLDEAQNLLQQVANTPVGGSKDIPILAAFARILSGLLAVYETDIYDQNPIWAAPEVSRAMAASIGRFLSDESLFTPFKSVIRTELQRALTQYDNYAEYEEMHLQLVATVGEEHFLTLLSRYGMAHAASRSGRTMQACEHFDRIIALTTATVGRHHPRFAMMLSIYGDMKFDLWRASHWTDEEALDQAEDMLTEALQIRQRSLGPHRLTGRSHYMLGRLELERNEHALALKQFSAALPMLVEFYGDHEKVTECLFAKAQAEIQLGQFKAGIQDARQALDTDLLLMRRYQQKPSTVSKRQLALADTLIKAPPEFKDIDYAQFLLAEGVKNAGKNYHRHSTIRWSAIGIDLGLLVYQLQPL